MKQKRTSLTLDQKDKPFDPFSWFVLVLNEPSEDLDPEVIRKGILKSLRGEKKAKVFVPAGYIDHKESRHVDFVLSGYAFVQGVSESSLSSLTNSKFVERALTIGRKYATVSQKDIDSLQEKASSSLKKTFRPGDLVTIVSGPYKEMSGEVICIIDEATVQISVRLRSKENLVSLPVSFLQLTDEAVSNTFIHGHGCLSRELVDRGETDALLSRIRYLVSLPSLLPLLDSYEVMTSAYKRYTTISKYKSQIQNLVSFFGPFVSLQPLIDRYFLLRKFVDLFQKLTYTSPTPPPPPTEPTKNANSRRGRTQSRVSHPVRHPKSRGGR